MTDHTKDLKLNVGVSIGDGRVSLFTDGETKGLDALSEIIKEELEWLPDMDADQAVNAAVAVRLLAELKKCVLLVEEYVAGDEA